jgi:RNA polymerase sigma factor (sigma-70 family)
MDYLPLVERVAKVEYRRIPSHMVDYEELVSIGALAIQALIKNKTPEQMARLNSSYIATATRWAIRNELRSRYKWYTLKKETNDEPEIVEGEGGEAVSLSPAESARETVYQTILSIDSMSAGEDGDASYDFIADTTATPEEQLEITELGKAIRRAIDALPSKERTIMEYRFYRNMQVKDIAAQVGLSSSRITRIVQASLNHIRQTLKDQQHIN